MLCWLRLHSELCWRQLPSGSWHERRLWRFICNLQVVEHDGLPYYIYELTRHRLVAATATGALGHCWGRGSTAGLVVQGEHHTAGGAELPSRLGSLLILCRIVATLA